MAGTVREILSSEMKHKEQVETLAGRALVDDELLAEAFDLLRTGSDGEKGTVAEVFKYVSKDNPDKMLPYIDTLIEYIDYKAPRVRWGCPESIGNMACKYAREVEGAIPKLLGNLNDASTVVRWCAAYALAEIAKYHPERQAELAERMRSLSQSEANNGVRNVYVKALKWIEKKK